MSGGRCRLVVILDRGVLRLVGGRGRLGILQCRLLRKLLDHPCGVPTELLKTP